MEPGYCATLPLHPPDGQTGEASGMELKQHHHAGLFINWRLHHRTKTVHYSYTKSDVRTLWDCSEAILTVTTRPDWFYVKRPALCRSIWPLHRRINIFLRMSYSRGYLG